MESSKSVTLRQDLRELQILNMTFGTFEFFIFLAALVGVYWSLKKWPAARQFFLVAASGYYYWLVDNRFAGLLVLAALITFLIARNIRGENRFGDKFYFGLGLALNLGILFWFKYYDFFRISIQSFFSQIGLPASLPFWEIALPIGISFYSFRMVSYLADVRRKKYSPETSLLNFFTYAFFFPHMLAGPIVRAGDFLSQLKNGGPKQPARIEVAASMLFLGLLKKVIISSWLAATLVDNAFAVPEQIGAALAWLAAIGYTMQIYCDFSGYSDIAIACAMFLGFELRPNFNFPYLAGSISEFWRRWHISFYSWMVDYVYIPLGGSRKGRAMSLINSLAVFALSGLWHGAAGHYILWGLWHGGGVCIQRAWSWSTLLKDKLGSIGGIAGWLATFSFVGMGWILFRAENVERAGAFVAALFRFESAPPVASSVAPTLALIVLFVFYERKITRALIGCQKFLPGILWPLGWITAIIVLYYFAPQTVPPFIYFSF